MQPLNLTETVSQARPQSCLLLSVLDPSAPPLTCLVCKKSFRHKSYYRYFHHNLSILATNLTSSVHSRHLDQHLKSFLCCEPNCSRKFGSKNDLSRHKREVHGEDDQGRALETLRCPHTDCKRNVKGFTRPSNLREHVRKMHGSDVGSDLSSTDSLGLCEPESSDHSDIASSQCSSPQLQPQRSRLNTRSPPRSSRRRDWCQEPVLRRIHAKLRSMETERRHLDSKISSLKFTLNALDNAAVKQNCGTQVLQPRDRRGQRASSHTPYLQV